MTGRLRRSRSRVSSEGLIQQAAVKNAQRRGAGVLGCRLPRRSRPPVWVCADRRKCSRWRRRRWVMCARLVAAQTVLNRAGCHAHCRCNRARHRCVCAQSGHAAHRAGKHRDSRHRRRRLGEEHDQANDPDQGQLLDSSARQHSLVSRFDFRCVRTLGLRLLNIGCTTSIANRHAKARARLNASGSSSRRPAR